MKVLLIIVGLIMPIHGSVQWTYEEYLGFNLTGYHSYDEITAYIVKLGLVHPELLTHERIGTSYEGREMGLVKISTAPDDNKDIIFVEAGTHAREWAAISTILALITSIVKTPHLYNLEQFDWYIVPCSNPDGYEYSRIGPETRLWRKNRSEQGQCHGVDLNRNQDIAWGTAGVSFDQCSSIYPGPYPTSEHEAAIIQSVLTKYSKRTKLFLSLHTSGNLILFPYGYTDESKPETWPFHQMMGIALANVIEVSRGSVYEVMGAAELYPASGCLDDYTFEVLGVPMVFTMELTDGYNFELPEWELKPVFQEVLPAFSYAGCNLEHYLGMIEEFKQYEYLRKNNLLH